MKNYLQVSAWTHIFVPDSHNAKMERDRELTEEKLIAAVGELIAAEGFETLKVRRVAEQAGVNKTLIYRYFTSLDGLVYAYMKKHDFWLNISAERPDTDDIKAYLRAFYRREISEYRKNIVLKRLRRWELSSNKEFVAEIMAQRERNGVQFLDMMAEFAKLDKAHIQAITALLDAGMVYLAILEENVRMYNGIDIRSDKGWTQIAAGIDALIDIMVKEKL